MSKPENGKAKDAPMTQDEDEDLASERNVRREDEAFAKEVKGLNRDGLIRLIIHDRLEIDRLWSELFKLRALKRRPAQESAKTKKANNPSAIVFGVKDFPALVLQAVDASRNSGIKEVRKKLVEIRLKDPSNKISEDILHQYARRELTSEKLKTIKKQRKPLFFE